MVFGLPFWPRPAEEMLIVRLEIVQTVPQTNLIEGDKLSTAKEEQVATVSKKLPPPPPPPPPPKRAAGADTAAAARAGTRAASTGNDAAAEIPPDKPQPKPVAKVELPNSWSRGLKGACGSRSRLPRPTKPAAAPKPKPMPTMKPPSKPEPPAPRRSKNNEVVASQLNKMVKDKKKARRGVGRAANPAQAQVRRRMPKRRARRRNARCRRHGDKDAVGRGRQCGQAPPKKSIAPVGSMTSHASSSMSRNAGSRRSARPKRHLLLTYLCR